MNNAQLDINADTRRSRSSDVLARKICASIVEERLEIGSHLREVHYSERLKVSRTLTRSAFKTLEEKGILERRPNRGFFLRDANIARQQIQEHSAASIGVELHPLCYLLARDHLHDELPAQFTEADIVRKYDESRPNVQQALIQMEKEGWIRRLLGYGWEFGEFLTSAISYEQCYRYRALIEPAALREPGYRADGQVLLKLRERQQALLHAKEGYSPIQIFNAGVEFHEAIVSFSGNPFLLEGIQKANRLRRLLEYSVHPTRREPQRECEDHLHIISLLEQGQYLQAADFLENHLVKARKDKSEIVRSILG
ncbi:FCD domain-containing protein [Billgrantia sp. LNSP4103-1]|uniref:FCD domain-containing protein n=1 Tax=Billgrantia sp. LNSP4103-1 TaxID=3410266 RepID=UPI00403F91F6